MDEPEIIKANDIRYCLKNLRKILPGEPEITYIFADYLENILLEGYTSAFWAFNASRIINDSQGNFVSGVGPYRFPKEFKGARKGLEEAFSKITNTILPEEFTKEALVYSAKFMI